MLNINFLIISDAADPNILVGPVKKVKEYYLGDGKVNVSITPLLIKEAGGGASV